mgnify:FL=1
MIKQICLLFIVLILLTACTVPSSLEPDMPHPDLADLGPAPELHDGQWLNQDTPLKLVDLRGQVVLLEMWTFGCINCQRVVPYVRNWHETYQDQGLIVIGNHYPEFNWEADVNNVKQALIDQNIP